MVYSIVHPNNCEHWSSVAATEFELIGRYFNQPGLVFDHPDVILGPGDDAAILTVPPGRHLVVSVDTLNVNVHFPDDASPALLAERCLRVNLSDLAAMGADPLGFTIALSLPAVSESWLQAFSEGLGQAAREFNCPLLGGDTTRGPLSVTITVHGHVPSGQALLRNGARPGDSIYVTGELGDAAAALWYLQTRPDFLARDISEAEHERWLQAFYRPQPRLAEGRALREIASATIDISDGLASDLAHLLEASTQASGQPTGAVIDTRQLPVSTDFRHRIASSQQISLALSGGDDYELCACIPSSQESAAVAALAATGTPFRRIGAVDSGPGIRLVDGSGREAALTVRGYCHFDDRAVRHHPGGDRASGIAGEHAGIEGEP